jgi:cytochrome c biogenesis protein CcmG/thiol:disulfide interchange protein DsbE
LKRCTVALALGLAVVLTACNGSSSSSSHADVGDTAPGFSTRDLTGKAVALRDYRGQTVVLNFWASWCVPCRHEFPLLAKIDARETVTVLGVVYNDSQGNARTFMTDHNGTWPGLVDDGQIARAYRVGPGIPATIVINPDGKIRRRNLGEIRSITALLK